MPKKVLYFKFQHETNAQCPKPADMTAYKYGHLRVGDVILTDPRPSGLDSAAALTVLEADGDIEIIPVVSMWASPSGPVSQEVYDFVTEKLQTALAENGPVDGIMILFHGAMVAEGHPDAEGDILEMLRGLVGGEIPIVASLDLHANVTKKMATLATALVPYENYPHTDAYETSYLAAQILVDALNGKSKPVMDYRRIPHLLPLFPTERAEIRKIYDLAAACQKRPGVLSVRFTHGFFAADIEELGMSVLAVTDGDPELAEAIAEEVAAAIDREKENMKDNYMSLDDALDLSLQPGDGPIVIADTSDNTGGGGMGNTTHILRRILERGLTGCALAIMVDPQCVAACLEAGVGARVHLSLGGWSDPTYSGGPLEVDAYVRLISDGWYTLKGPMTTGTRVCMGKTVVLDIAGNQVIVVSLPFQPYDLEVFRAHGIAPEELKLLVVKSSIHYRASFGTVARKMIPVPLPGYNVPYPQGYNFRNWKGKV